MAWRRSATRRMLALAAAAAIGYLLGAIPFGVIVGRLVRGVDIRDYGSHRTGATNALRTLGARAALAVFVLDSGKGAAAVLLAGWLAGRVPDAGGPAAWGAAVAGVAAIVGHNRSIFIRFTGGRGVATSSGALLALAPLALLALAPVVIFVIWRWRYVSLGSVLGALLAPVAVGILHLLGMAPLPPFFYALAAALLVTGSHADNISRLRAGTERKIGQKEEIRHA